MEAAKKNFQNLFSNTGSWMKNLVSDKLALSKVIGLLVTLIILTIIPHFLKNTQLILFSRIFILAVYGMSYDILRGYTGFINLGQAIFFGSGVYIGVIFLNMQNDLYYFILAVLVVIVFSLVGGYLMSKIVFRAGGVVAAAMITLALAEIVRNLAERWRAVTGGQDGLPLNRSRITLEPLFSDRIGGYYFALVFLIVMTILLRKFVQSPTGKVLLSIRENEQRARFLGYDTIKYKTIALVVSSVASGLAGVFFAVIVRFANTDYLSLQYTINALLMTLVGGTGTLYGAIIGSGFITYIQKILLDLNSSLGYQILRFPMIFIGSIYVLLVMFMPTGLIGGITKLYEFIQNKASLKKDQVQVDSKGQ